MLDRKNVMKLRYKLDKPDWYNYSLSPYPIKLWFQIPDLENQCIRFRIENPLEKDVVVCFGPITRYANSTLAYWEYDPSVIAHKVFVKRNTTKPVDVCIPELAEKNNFAYRVVISIRIGEKQSVSMPYWSHTAYVDFENNSFNLELLHAVARRGRGNDLF